MYDQSQHIPSIVLACTYSLRKDGSHRCVAHTKLLGIASTWLVMVMQQQQQSTMNKNIHAAKTHPFSKNSYALYACIKVERNLLHMCTSVLNPIHISYIYIDTLQFTHTEPVSDIELWIRLVLMLAAFQANADEHITRAKWEKNT